MPSPRISVLLPCFNAGAWVDEAVASVFAQTFQDFEILIVDDGSTDPATLEKLKNYRDPRIAVLRTINRGLPAARNHAARSASGELFCALDADDRLAPTWFEKGVALLVQRPDLAFVSHWLEAFGDEQWTWKPERCDLPALLATNTVNGAALVRREPFETIGGYDESMRDGCEDWDFWLRLVERGFEGAIIPEVLFHYRRRRESMSRMMHKDAVYPKPLDTIVMRHEVFYRRHVIDLLVAKEQELVQLRQEVSKLQRDRLSFLEPSLARAREELAAVHAKVERARPVVAAEQDEQQLTARVAELEREVSALRASWSWWITGPARRVYSWLTGRP
jgi:glycosyltransferase involved in cell wall biosynthesis